MSKIRPHPQPFSPGEKGARNLVPSPLGRGIGQIRVLFNPHSLVGFRERSTHPRRILD
jgi:hypothetical protein